MSYAHGEVWKEGECVAYFDFDGDTMRVVSNIVYDAKDFYLRHMNRTECRCRGEIVLLHTRYGGGFSWIGRVCFGHGTITKGVAPFESDFRLGADWYPYALQEEG